MAVAGMPVVSFRSFIFLYRWWSREMTWRAWSSLVTLHSASNIALSACLSVGGGVLQWMGSSLLFQVAPTWFG